MAEIPAGEYTQHIHRSIDQLRSMNERGVLGTLTTDLRGQLVHEYKQFSDRLIDQRLVGGDVGITLINGVNTDLSELRHQQQQQQQQHQQQDHKNFINNSSPSTPPTPISMEVQMNDTKIFNSKGDLQLHTGGGGGGGGGVGGGGGGTGTTHSRRNNNNNNPGGEDRGENKPYKCTQCTKSFANSSYLSQHTRIHLGIKPYRCEICQRKFTQLSHLQQHIRTHTGDKPYKCRHVGCQKAFSQLSNLQSHSRCHQTDKPYKCNSCYKCFQDETALLDHIPKHKESKHLKTHICQYCGKSYTQETYLAKHVQKHTERPEKINQRATAAAAATSATTLAGLGINLNRNLGLANTTLTVGGEHHPYWPKVSPDSAAATIVEAMQQQQQTIQYDFSALGQHSVVAQHATQEQLQQHHRALLNHHRVLNGVIDTGGGNNNNNNNNNSNNTNNDNNTDGEDLVVVRQQNTNNLGQQQHITTSNNNSASSTPNGSNNNNNNNANSNSNNNNNNNNNNNTTTTTTIGGYDAASITKTTINSSAFTPINAMTMAPHLNTLTHHQFQRPYLYDAISFQNNKNAIVNQNTVSNSFPNQLISLHQIRNYSHQPTGPGLMAGMVGENLIGIGVGAGKDKGQ